MKFLYLFLLSLLLLVWRQGNAQNQSNYIVQTGNADSPGIYNTLIGPGAGLTSSGNENTFVGYQAGKQSFGGSNSFFGAQAGLNNGTGVENSFFGSQAGNFNRGGSQNTFVGMHAGYRNSEGNANVFVGARAGRSNATGGGNVYIGNQAGEYNVTGELNTFVGFMAGFANLASANTFIGFQAGQSNTYGRFNTFIGVNAGLSNTIGFSNFMMGTNVGTSNTAGSANFFLGDNAGQANTTGSYNVFLGTNAGASNVTGRDNTLIGFGANVGSANLANATAIGNQALVNQSNSLVLGNGANVGIGTSAPTNKLHLVSGTAGQSGLRLENLPITTTATTLNQTKFLTVDGQGNVILASLNSGGREAAAESLWQLNGAFLQNANGEAVIIGSGVTKTPADYNLFVSKGILTEKVKVAVKNTDAWSDRVFEHGYQLRNLSKVEQYIQRNGHLPGIPSAEEVVKQGVDVGQMQAKLLEKVEELTLYVIQLEKKVQALERTRKQKTRSAAPKVTR